VAVFAARWLGGDAALVVLWCVPPWLRGRRRARLPARYGPLPVPLASAPARYADAELLAVDAVLWSYAEAVGTP
jgi:hypothetical protein